MLSDVEEILVFGQLHAKELSVVNNLLLSGLVLLFVFLVLAVPAKIVLVLHIQI